MDQIPKPNEKKEEKLEFLKRDEIQTMEKDVAKLREGEAQKERERVSSLMPEEKTEKVKMEDIRREPLGKTEEPKKDILIPRPPQKPPISRKLLIRVLPILLVFLIAGFLYWYFAIRADETPSQAPPETEQPEETPSPPETTGEEPVLEEKEVKAPKPSTIQRMLSQGFYAPSTPRIIDTIIIHSAYNVFNKDYHDVEGIIQEYEFYQVAAHYLVDRQGIIYQMVTDEDIAYHAGTSRMPDGRTDVNNFSVGIELIYTKTETPTETQYQTLAQLVKYLEQEHDIPSENILGQNQIAPDRKTDPWNFDWQYFYSLIEISSLEQTEVEEPSEETKASKPLIAQRILGLGYHFPGTPRTIDTIIIHSVYNALEGNPHDVEGVIQEYTLYKVAAHYLITRDSLIYQTVPDKAVAYHAGFSEMPDGRINVNDFSIGIEVVYTKTETPTETQYQALAQLVKYLQQEYNVPLENILGHKDVAPDRKTDPWNFDWEKFNQMINN